MIKILLPVLVLILLGNLAILNYLVFQQDGKFKDINTRISMLAESVKKARNSGDFVSDVVPTESGDSCGAECLAAIDKAVSEKVASSKTTAVKTTVAASPTTYTKEFIIPMGSGTVSQTGEWVDIYSAQTQINTANYPPIKSAYFEVVMSIPNGQGTIKARLYDTSTPYLFAGQVLQTQSATGEFLSVQFPIQQGTKNYHVQLNNSIGTGILNSSRIRLVTN